MGVAIGVDYTDPDWAIRLAEERVFKAATGRAKPGELMFGALASAHAAKARRGLGVDIPSLITAELASQTSDYVSSLADIGGRILFENLGQSTPTYRRIAREQSFANFKPHTLVPPSEFPNMLRVNEHGEFKVGFVGDRGETASLATYGRIIAVTRALLLADDIGQFGALFADAGRRLAEFVNSVFMATCITPNSGLGQTMGDGVVMFHSSHGNVASAGALSATTLGSARALLRAQTTAEGQALNLASAFLLVSPASETLAEVLVQTLPAGSLTVIADAALTGTRFYVIADPNTLPAFAFGSLIDGDGPQLATRHSWDIDGLETRISFDFGATCLDHRGAATGAGA